MFKTTSNTTSTASSKQANKQATNRISFENKGQELSWIEVTDSGEIVSTHPNHALIWKGRFIDLETAKEGDYPEYIDVRTGQRDYMNHRVKSVEPINREE